MSSNYNTDSIESLGILGGVREKPASIGLENHKHTFIEILANSIDEHREGYGNKIIVTRYSDYSISIEDFGRSVPMDKNSKGEYAYEKVFNELWSGGKYNNNKNEESKGNYLYSLGTNGCGATGTNYTSDFFEATAYAPNGYEYYIKYEKGVQKTELIKKIHNKDKTGTVIHWMPSKEVFRGSYIIDENFINTILEQQAIVNKGLKFTFIDHINNTEKEYIYNDGIKEYIEKISEEKNFTDIIIFNNEDTIHEIIEDSNLANNKYEYDYRLKSEIYITFSNEVNLIDFYHNSSHLVHGGTPEAVIKNALTYSIDKYIKDKGLYDKGENKVKFDDIKDSLIVISNTFSTISLYSDQTKKCIESKGMQKHLINFLKQQLEIYLIENPLEAEKIARQILVNKRANDKANKSKQEYKKKLQTQSKGMSPKVEGLKDCDMDDSTLEERILLCSEGVSAKSTIDDCLDARIMGSYGLGGRFINALKSSLDDVFKNVPALGLVNALGCGVEIPKNQLRKFKDLNLFDNDNLRYGKIGLVCDADEFGSSINLSLITFFYQYLPTLLKEGRVYIVTTPRFSITTKDKVFHVYNEQEKLDVIKELNEQNIKFDVSIRKGLGEFNQEEFWEYVLCEKAREKCFIQVTYEGAEEVIKQHFDMFMGENISERKRFIHDNIVNVNLSEID